MEIIEVTQKDLRVKAVDKLREANEPLKLQHLIYKIQKEYPFLTPVQIRSALWNLDQKVDGVYRPRSGGWFAVEPSKNAQEAAKPSFRSPGEKVVHSIQEALEETLQQLNIRELSIQDLTDLTYIKASIENMKQHINKRSAV